MIQARPKREENLFNAALCYARKGWPVIPVYSVCNGVCACRKGLTCDAPGKHPYHSSWGTIASTDPEVIKEWWDHSCVGANIGVLTGLKSRIFCLDVDVPRLDANISKNGPARLAELINLHGELPITGKVSTGSGGSHYFFEMPSNAEFKKEIAPGLDIKANGGFVVAPPSIHKSGNLYTWELLPGTSKFASIVCAPNWLIEMATKSLDVRQDFSKWEDVLFTPILPGQRNNEIAKIVGALVRARLDPYLVRGLVRLINQHVCTEPLSHYELETIVTSITKRDFRKSGEQHGQST
jgi:putative DNA primase/helicase